MQKPETVLFARRIWRDVRPDRLHRVACDDHNRFVVANLTLAVTSRTFRIPTNTTDELLVRMQAKANLRFAFGFPFNLLYML